MWEIFGEFLNLVAKNIINATAAYVKFENKVKQNFREMGYNGQQLRNITKEILVDTQKWGVQYGITADEAFELRKGLAAIQKTTAQLSEDTKNSFAALTKIVGADTATAAAKSMQQFGIHSKTAAAWVGKGVIQAKALGLNTKEFTEQMSQSIALMNKMHFKTGITGLQKMIGLATRLGTSVETLTRHIDIDGGAFSDIEKSIETAAQLQRLGGSWAANFGNPMEVMAEGMFDAESAADRLTKTLEGKSVFNRATGQADMSWYNSKQLGVAAQALGIDPTEARSIAKRSAMGTAIESDLGAKRSMFSEEELDAIKNLAEFDLQSQKFQISYSKDGQIVTANIEDLTKEQLEEAMSLTEAEKNVDRNVATIAGQVTNIARAMGATASQNVTAAERAAGIRSAYESRKIDWMGLDKTVDWANQASVPAAETAFGWGDSIANGINNTFKGVGNFLKSLWPFEDGGIVTPDAVPKFASGGISPAIVGGTSYAGDRVLARVNSGEMILNKAQQAQLFRALSTNNVITATAKAAVNPLSLVSNASTTGRYVRSSLRTLGPEGIELAKGLETVAGKIDSFKAATQTTLNGVKSTVVNSKYISPIIEKANAVAVEIGKAGKIITKPFNAVGTAIGNAGKAVTSSAKVILDPAKQLINKGVENVTSKVASSTIGQVGGKVVSKLGKGGTLAAGIESVVGLWNAGSAISDFGKIKNSIENSGLSKKEKKEYLRKAEDNRNEKVGGGVGKAAGAIAATVAVNAIPVVGQFLAGSGLAAMAGGWLGEKVGGVIGKSVNGVKDFLFGTKNELDDADQAQLDYEETKMGMTDLSDPQLMEKSALATLGIHDLLISIWHKMNGKLANGEEVGKAGLFGNIASGVSAIAKGALGLATAPMRGVAGVAKSVFGTKTNIAEGNVLSAYQAGMFDRVTNIDETLQGYVESRNKQAEGSEETSSVKGEYSFKPITLAYSSGLGTLMTTGNILGKESTSTVKPTIEGNGGSAVEIKPEPIGSENIKFRESERVSTTNTYNGSETVKLEVSGTIKLDAGTASKDIDFKKLLDDPQIQNIITNFVVQKMTAVGGRSNENPSFARTGSIISSHK